MVGDSDKVVEEIRVEAVTKPKSTPDQDLLRRLLVGMAPPAPVRAPVPEVLMVEKLLQCLVAETQIRQPALLWFHQSLRDWKICSDCYSRGSRHRCSSLGRDPSGGIGMPSYVFHAGRRVIMRLVAPFWASRFRLCCRGGGPRRNRVVTS